MALPAIPENITVHLGPPSSDAENVTVPFIHYIANVASSELYPTWPESALRANIIAQTSFALNRVYTEYYRSRGYDPVDGTKDFVARDGGFTTNIALAYKHEAVVGVVVVPLTGEIYYAAKGLGAFYRKDGVTKQIHVNNKTDNLIVYKSVFHSKANEEAMYEKHKDKIAKVEKWGSALKPCRIAQGLGELSYRLNDGTKEWDTAASQVIVEQAGGIFDSLVEV